MLLSACVKTSDIYAKYWTAGLANLITVKFKDEFGNDVAMPYSRVVITANYVTQPSPPVVVVAGNNLGSSTVDVNIYVNKTGSVTFRLRLDSDVNNWIYDITAIVSPSIFSASASYATLGSLVNSVAPFPNVFATAGSAPIQPWYAHA